MRCSSGRTLSNPDTEWKIRSQMQIRLKAMLRETRETELRVRVRTCTSTVAMLSYVHYKKISTIQ